MKHLMHIKLNRNLSIIAPETHISLCADTLSTNVVTKTNLEHNFWYRKIRHEFIQIDSTSCTLTLLLLHWCSKQVSKTKNHIVVCYLKMDVASTLPRCFCNVFQSIQVKLDKHVIEMYKNCSLNVFPIFWILSYHAR